MAVNWTEGQLNAITRRGGALLVSAAAGSGKTAVLVERVIRRILDENDPCSIDEFLIVTFTKAAAAEMKAKIADALTAKLLDDPGSRRLRRQLSLLDRAQITTVHSFCAYLLRENFQAAGLAPDFRVADEDEIAMLRDTVLDEMIEERYEAEENAGFLMLVEALSAMRDDTRLRSVLMETYEKVQSHPYPEKWLSEMAAAEPEEDPITGVYGRIVMESILSRCRWSLLMLEEAVLRFAEYPPVEKAYGKAFAADLENLRQLIALLKDGDWDAAADFANHIAFARLGAVRGFEDPVLLELIKAPRDTWKKTLATLCRDYFGFSRAQLSADMAAVRPYGEVLLSLVSEFIQRLDAEKRMRGIVDFGDLEHLTVRMLLGEDGREPTPMAHALSARYTEIMVDEYQDTNDVQDAIFRALSREERNLFMVGDIKQSIYSFRLANPEVFLRKYLSYQDDPPAGEPCRIVLAQNFRSRREVTESVNYIFEKIMSTDLGDVTYGEAERLVPGAAYPAGEGYESELCLVETEEEGELSSAEADAAYVAGRIREMLDQGFPVYDRNLDAMRPCRAEDFAILLRSVKSKAGFYEAALARAGISALQDVGAELFSSPDVMILMSLIDVLDNPEQDIPLASLMRSPLYGFTADELAQIRAAHREGSFLQAVQEMATCEDALGLRCRGMLDALSALRRSAADLSADRLVLRILHETRLEAVCSHLTEGGGMIRAFLEQAQRFERAGYCGLYRFAQMMRTLRERGCEVAAAPSEASAVRIMSIHKSKGLEFPIVFLANCAQRFNTRDLTEPVLIHPTLGAGFRRRQLTRRIEYPTLPRLAIALQAKREMLSEEERILYVAMTRAKEKLIVTAPVKNAAELAAKLYPDACSDPIPPQMLLNCAGILPWVLVPLLRLPTAAHLLAEGGIAAAFPDREDHAWMLRKVRPTAAKPRAAREDAPAEALPYEEEELAVRLRYEYPYGAAADLPSKLTATALKGRFADEEAAEQAVQQLPTAAMPFRRPRFIRDRGLTGAERGTALHLVMQFIDFAACGSEESIRQEVESLRQRRFLTEEQAEVIDVRKIAVFFRSPLGQRLMASSGIYREFKFSLLAPAELAKNPAALARIPTAEEDTILFQGVIDCYFEEGDGLVLLDFKTDFVLPGQEALLADRYRPQLSAYAIALKRITGKPVREQHLYLFHPDLDLML